MEARVVQRTLQVVGHTVLLQDHQLSAEGPLTRRRADVCGSGSATSADSGTGPFISGIGWKDLWDW